jgi:hypothetical protein
MSVVGTHLLYVGMQWLRRLSPWRPCPFRGVGYVCCSYCFYFVRSRLPVLVLLFPLCIQLLSSTAEQFFGSPLVLSKPMMQVLSSCGLLRFHSGIARGQPSHLSSAGPCICRLHNTGCGFPIPGAYPPHPLPHRADADFMFCIVV